MTSRRFYMTEAWFAVLDSRPMLPGHVLLAARSRGGACPAGMSRAVLAGVDRALAEVVDAMELHFGHPVLTASLRGKHAHCHFHLVPAHSDLVAKWRDASDTLGVHEGGHLFEFLGEMEKRKPPAARDDSYHQHDRDALRALTGYEESA